MLVKMHHLLSEYGTFWNKRNRNSLYVGILFFILALYIQGGASRYSERSATRFVGDVFLDNLPTVNLNFIVVEGALFLTLAIIILLVVRPRYLIFSLKSMSILIVVRSFFVTLTHLGIYPNPIIFDNTFFDRLYLLFNLQGGYFFSGHVGTLFLMALIFWDEKFWRWTFLALSVLMGVVVLLAHIHYSIDVFAAPFMVYGIFRIAQELFPTDYKLIAG